MPEVELEPDLVLADLPAAAALLGGVLLRPRGRCALRPAAVADVDRPGAADHGASWPWSAARCSDLPWAVAFALGAIVSPTDPVAATAIMRRLGAPRRIVNLVEGESLFNDAAALVALPGRAWRRPSAGAFSLIDASLEFVGAAVGGVAVGLAVGWVIGEIRRRLDDPLTEITISLFTGYAAFLPAERAAPLRGAGGGRRRALPRLARPRSCRRPRPGCRRSPCGTCDFLLNATLFVLIGLQLPVVLDGLDGRSVPSWSATPRWWSCTVIAARFVWLFTTPYLDRGRSTAGRSSASAGSALRPRTRGRPGRGCGARCRWRRRWRSRWRPTPARRCPGAT